LRVEPRRHATSAVAAERGEGVRNRSFLDGDPAAAIGSGIAAEFAEI